ncbi:GNAT family acetyltransferase [Myceligenerans pegani]|uniref:GNAT family acetyltransferase n=1 Tax=Myceligenerans pegani TaxID=2776917 RepID=A0ABR9MSJ0_9MICO|nr:GNAT family acetyltransferase [Myceligenerans sp. TRM 65318]MBE1874339.1 GNAT family acetyltransferase [Myceligenerans sp. TRM 65318]MBE3016610.1 GNAT family acetyltransferase [Myceligenerans sp. TRM 65318]
MSQTDVVAEFTEITDDDVEGVVALWHACGLTRPWNDPHLDIADARSGPTSTVLVFRDDGGAPRGNAADGAPGRVVASVMAGFDGHRGWLYYVAVAPDRQGDGLGRAAVAAGENWLRATGARKVQLMVRATNSAVVDFYERLGYTDQETTVLGRWF